MKPFVAIPALLLACASLSAEEIKGKVVAADAEKGSLTLSVDGKDRTLAVEKGAAVQAPGKKNALTDVAGGLAGLKAGDEATATVETKDGKDVVTKVLTGATKKAKKNAAGATTVVAVDADKRTLTVSTDGKEKTLTVAAGATIQAPGKKKMPEDVAGGLKGLKAGDELTVSTEKQDGKDVVTKLVVAGKKKVK